MNALTICKSTGFSFAIKNTTFLSVLKALCVMDFTAAFFRILLKIGELFILFGKKALVSHSTATSAFYISY
jgi:hypothetical protein